jgi:DNA-binding CsgD family transcriptional regulator
MSISHFENGELLALLHAGLFEDPLWHSFLESLRQMTYADHCGIYFRRADVPATQSTSVSAGQSRPVHIRDLYDKIFHRLDPVPYDQLRPGRVYSLAEFMLPADKGHEAYRKDYMIPSGMNFKRIMRVTGQNDYNAWITIWAGKNDFRAKHDSLLSSLYPHISIALRTYEMVERNGVRARIANEAVRRLNFGWLTLDSKCEIVDIDPEAENMLELINVSGRFPSRRLRLPSPKAQKGLSEAIREYQENPNARARALNLHDDPGIDMLIMPMGERTLSGPRTAILTAYLHGESGPQVQRVDQLMDLFTLTRGEARLALALSRGKSITEAAHDLTLTVETARNYSKKIYSKTGARGQPDLVRIVLASVVALV